MFLSFVFYDPCQLLVLGLYKEEYYPRATRFGGDVVTLLWFCPSMCACVLVSVCPSRFDIVIMIETKPLCPHSSNLKDMFTMERGWTLLILEVKAQDHNLHIWEKACKHDRDLTIVCFFIKLCIHVTLSHYERMDSINFGSQRWKHKPPQKVRLHSGCRST